MNLPSLRIPSSHAWLPIAALLAGGVLPCDVSAQSADPDAVLAELKTAQMEFEQFRESKTPILRGGPVEGSCDERIGRMCIWFGGEDEADYPAELREVTQAREQFVRDLTAGFEIAPHRWILGQLVHYAVESGNEDRAAALARPSLLVADGARAEAGADVAKGLDAPLLELTGDRSLETLACRRNLMWTKRNA